MDLITDGDLIWSILSAANWMPHKEMHIDYDGGELNSWFQYVVTKDQCPAETEDVDLCQGSEPQEVHKGTELSALEAIRNVEMARQGLFFIDECGDANWQSRFNRLKRTSAVDIFINCMTDLTYELNDRLIYNDIRSTTTVTKTRKVHKTVWVQKEAGNGGGTSGQGRLGGGRLLHAGETDTIWCSLPQDMTCDRITNVWAIASDLGGELAPIQCSCSWEPCLDPHFLDATVTAPTSEPTPTGYWGEIRGYWIIDVYASWGMGGGGGEASQGEWVDKCVDEEYEAELEVYASDDESITKYGKRTLNLTWPLGETEVVAQSIVDSYLAKYKEPFPTISVTFWATDDLIDRLLSRHISDRVEIISTLAKFDADCFIDKIDISWNPGEPLKVKWGLSYITAEPGIWILNISQLEVDTVLR